MSNIQTRISLDLPEDVWRKIGRENAEGLVPV